jgi:hypothetical protein
MRRWTPERIAEAMLTFEREHGRRLRSNDVTGKAAPPGMPSGEAIRHHFGSFRVACEVAYGEGLAPGGRRTKDDDTERVIVGLYAGRTLTDLARERDMSGQALGRRVVRYLRAQGLPALGRRPGRPADWQAKGAA